MDCGLVALPVMHVCCKPLCLWWPVTVGLETDGWLRVPCVPPPECAVPSSLWLETYLPHSHELPSSAAVSPLARAATGAQ